MAGFRSLFVLLLSAGGSGADVPTAPARMRAAAMMRRPWDLKFHLDQVAVIDKDVPEPGHGEVLVQVHTSNINPVDHKVVQIAGLAWTYPHKLGFDLAGTVVRVGCGCDRIRAGDEVWGEATSFPKEAVTTGGTFAQYAVVSESVLGLKPKDLSWKEAGAMPMVALTGVEALTWAAGGRKFNSSNNVTVLVLGGSGGTGHVGIQIAKAMGAARVITTCSAKNADFVRSLGADEVIDYHKDNYSEVLSQKSVDMVYDCVGLAGTGDLAYPLIKDHGHFATLLPTGAASKAMKSQRSDIQESKPLCVGGCSHYDRIDMVSELVQSGKLKVHIDVTYGLEDIVKAYNHSIAGHSVGKVALDVTPSSTEALIV